MMKFFGLVLLGGIVVGVFTFAPVAAIGIGIFALFGVMAKDLFEGFTKKW